MLGSCQCSTLYSLLSTQINGHFSYFGQTLLTNPEPRSDLLLVKHYKNIIPIIIIIFISPVFPLSQLGSGHNFS